jgi:hypothetical protein
MSSPNRTEEDSSDDAGETAYGDELTTDISFGVFEK